MNQLLTILFDSSIFTGGFIVGAIIGGTVIWLFHWNDRKRTRQYEETLKQELERVETARSTVFLEELKKFFRT